MPNTKCKDVSIFMTTLKHSTEVAHQQLYIFIAARLVSDNHWQSCGAIINGHLFGQHLRLPRELAPVALRLLLPCCGTINLIDNLSREKKNSCLLLLIPSP